MGLVISDKRSNWLVGSVPWGKTVFNTIWDTGNGKNCQTLLYTGPFRCLQKRGENLCMFSTVCLASLDSFDKSTKVEHTVHSYNVAFVMNVMQSTFLVTNVYKLLLQKPKVIISRGHNFL